jgi:hypothetical protein
MQEIDSIYIENEIMSKDIPYKYKVIIAIILGIFYGIVLEFI